MQIKFFIAAALSFGSIFPAAAADYCERSWPPNYSAYLNPGVCTSAQGPRVMEIDRLRHISEVHSMVPASFIAKTNNGQCVDTNCENRG